MSNVNYNAKKAAVNTNYILTNAKRDLNLEDYEKLEASYRRGVRFSIMFIIGLVIIIVAGIAIIGMVTRTDGLLGTVTNNYTVRYNDGTRYHNVDLGKLSSRELVGKQVIITLEDEKVTKVVLFSEYTESQRSKVMMCFVVYVLVLYIYSFVYIKLYRTKVANYWYKYSQNHKKSNLNHSGNASITSVAKMNNTTQTIANSSDVIEAMGKIQNVEESDEQIIFNFENGYKVKAKIDYKFIGGCWIVKDSMKVWEEPHKKDAFDSEVIAYICLEVADYTVNKSVKYVFV